MTIKCKKNIVFVRRYIVINWHQLATFKAEILGAFIIKLNIDIKTKKKTLKKGLPCLFTKRHYHSRGATA